MFCRHCGAGNEAGSKFCEACGAKIVIPRQDRLERRSEEPELISREKMVRRFDDTELVSQAPVASHSRGIPYDKEGFGAESSPGTQANAHRGNGPTRRKKLLLIGFGALLLVVLLLAGWVLMGIQNTRAFNDAMDEGNRYLLEENLEQAEAHFLRAIEINPREVEPYLQLASIYREWGEVDRAIEILEQGREVVPEEDRSALEEVLDEIREIEGAHPPADEGDEEDEPRFRWVLEPSIEADDINFIKYRGHQATNMNMKHFSSTHAVIRRGNTYGLIDSQGNIEGGMYFQSVEHRLDTYVLHLIESRELEGSTAHYFSSIWFDGSLEPWFSHCGGVGGHAIFYYFNGLEFVITICSGPPAPRDIIEAPGFPIPVLNATEYFFSENVQSLYAEFEGARWYDSQDGLYGIFYQGQMSTDFVYTSTGSWLDGAIAVEQNGRWGYVNERGEIIIPIEFDSSWVWSNWRMGEYIEVESAFAASEGFIPLVRDGVWEMRDIHGEVVIPPGIFEAIRPVYQGRSWVLQDGLWGIIEILPADVTNQAETTELELSIEELGRRIETAGTFWEDWWTLSGWFTRENIQWLDRVDEEPEVLGGHPGSWGWISLESPLGNDIHNFLMQHYTESWVNAELTRPQAPRIIEYNGILYIMGARAGLARFNWETATHVLIEQEGGHAIVETTVLFGAWHRPDFDPMDYATEEIFRFTFINGRINSIDSIGEVELW